MSPRPVDRRTAEALLSGRAVDGEPELTAFVGQLRDLAEAPAPSLALYGLLSEGFTPDPDAHVVRAVTWTRTVTWTRAAAVLGAAVLALTGGAAANALPRPVQDAVADVVEAVTPISVPRPAVPVVPAEDRGSSEDVRQDGTGTGDTLQRDDNGGHGQQPVTVDDRKGSGRDDAPGQDRSGKGSGSGTSRDDTSGDDTSGDDRSGDDAPGQDRSGKNETPSSSSGEDHSGSSGSGKDRPEPVRTEQAEDTSGSDDSGTSGKDPEPLKTESSGSGSGKDDPTKD